ncbi:11651_t:CDS:2 [Ambispora gerdemannii]|uniref:11651_t:CDS:1 n=1 Tax=Ambispora gerdemannii TaxID=144530 RepID=A0A9N9D8F9_9GLOM|nr:11651_t:CDS:2 [Ambispora gerdemannii]
MSELIIFEKGLEEIREKIYQLELTENVLTLKKKIEKMIIVNGQKRLNEIDKLKNNSDQIKNVLELNPTDDLPTDWQAQLAKKDELEATQKKTKFPNTTPEKAREEFDGLKSRPTGGAIAQEEYDKIRIDLSEHELKEVVFINCPNLEFIDVTSNGTIETLDIEKLTMDSANNPTTNKLNTLKCGRNKIVKIDFTHCQNLKNFECPNNPTLDRIENIDRVEGIEMINMKKSGPVKIMHEAKAAVFKGVVNEVKELFGVEHASDLPLEQLINKIVAVQSPQLKTGKENAEKERDEAKAKLETIKTERDQLQQQLTAIKSELGLTENVTKEQVVDKIKELMNRPTSSCSHTDYDTIKSDNESKKRKIDELESNKENESGQKFKMRLPRKKGFNNWQFVDLSLSAYEANQFTGKRAKERKRKVLVYDFSKNARNDYEKAGTIQAFEVCYELAKNTIRKVLLLRAQEVHVTPKEIFRLTNLEGLIPDAEI